MLRKGFLKPEISISTLGKSQFWTGIIIGVGISFILNYFLNYSREALRLFTFFGDPYILSEKEFRIYDIFFTCFSTSIGFGFTIIYWLRGKNVNIKKNYLRTYTITNSVIIIFISLMAVSRVGSILPIILYSFHGYDNHLDILNDFWLLFVLIPIYIFFTNWNSIRLLFRTKNWILISMLFYGLTSFYLYKTTTVDREKLNKGYYTHNKERFEYIDKEIKNARSLGVYFSDTTKLILQKRYAERTTDLVQKTKKAFKSDSVVSLDTLLLQKIIIHNMNDEGYSWRMYRKNKIEENWSYPMPEEIYNQILKRNIDDPEMKILFGILFEQISLFTAKEINWNNSDSFSIYEREKSMYKRDLLFFTQTIQSRLIQVIQILKSNERYEQYHHIIPEFEFQNDRNGNQKHYELKLTGANTAHKKLLN
jgi:hypothetical protein